MASSPAIGAVATGARTARRDLRRFVVAGSALVVLGLVWAAALDARGLHGVPGIPLDESWMRTIHAIRTPPMVAAAQVFAWLGAAPGSIVVAAVIALALWWRRGIRVGLTFVVVTLLSEANVDAMKAVDLRQRPQGGLWGGIGSFPSGHTAFAAVVAATLGML